MEPQKSTLMVPLQWISLTFLIMGIFPAATPSKLPPLSTILREPETSPELISDDFRTFFYNQTLDHFNYGPESYDTFPQRYVVNFRHWGGANASAPIFAYLGAEASLDYALTGVGFLLENAIQFKALLVYIEHRYYGESIPFGSREEALKNASTRGYFNSAQALADYAEVLLHVKKDLQAEDSPVIVIGGSYGGMLASWFRLKYPHVALGALASSAPILYFDDITPENGYYSTVTEDFREASESCYSTIRKSWSEIDRVASQSNGLSTLSKTFKTCSELNKSDELKDYLDTMYAVAAQYNHPPKYPVTPVCGGIDGAAEGSDVLGRIFAGLVAFRGNKTCYNTTSNPTETSEGWRWQTCSEMVMPIGRGDNDTMFPPAPFNLTTFIQDCTSLYGVPPRPHWITTYYGGHDVKLVLRRFASNIIFSNGLRDPYSSAGVLKNISHTLVAIHTVNGKFLANMGGGCFGNFNRSEPYLAGSHCLDILPAKPTDPEWLIMQRKTEVEIIQGWIVQYHADLNATRKRRSNPV